MSKPRDTQQSKLYRVERIWYDNYPVSKNPKDLDFKDEREASNYATWIWINFKKKIYPRPYKYRVPRVKVKWKNRGGWSYAMNSNGWYETKTGSKYKLIKLSGCHRNFHILIHEMAHHIIPKYNPNNHSERLESHGPEFTKLLMFLLAYYLDYDINFMVRTANEHNLRFSSEDVYLNTQFNKLIQKQRQLIA